jgi:putative restriction endonuclease
MDWAALDAQALSIVQSMNGRQEKQVGVGRARPVSTNLTTNGGVFSRCPNMAEPRRWTREELLVALNLYGKLRFGQFHKRQPVVLDIAGRMRRTPGSLAMKLSNLASLDQKLRARGIAGLAGASQLDRLVWEEYQGNRESMILESEEALRRLLNAEAQDEVEVAGDSGVSVVRVPSTPEGPTSALASVRIRRGQQYFRQVVLNAFGGRCGVTGISLRELLVASHILPWAKYPESRLDPQNGIALSRLHDGAFDRGLIAFDDSYRLLLSTQLRRHLPHQALEDGFSKYEGKPLDIPSDVLPPSPSFLAKHREIWGFS